MERKPTKQSMRGLSGQSYTFEVYDFGTSFTGVSAVYVLAKYEHGTILPLYIGETENLEERLGDCLARHEVRPCVEEHGYTHICILQVPGGETRRLAIETDLRNRYKTPCNKQHQSSSSGSGK